MDVKWLVKNIKKAGLLALITGGAELASDFVKHRAEKDEDDTPADKTTETNDTETEKVPDEDVTVEEETES